MSRRLSHEPKRRCFDDAMKLNLSAWCELRVAKRGVDSWGGMFALPGWMGESMDER